MVEADKLLEDDELIDLVFEAQGERHQHSATNGRGQTPADIAMRLLLLKHVRNWSFAVLEREVKLNLAYRGRQLQWPGASWFYRLRVCGRAGCWLIWLR